MPSDALILRVTHSFDTKDLILQVELTMHVQRILTFLPKQEIYACTTKTPMMMFSISVRMMNLYAQIKFSAVQIFVISETLTPVTLWDIRRRFF